MPPADEEHTADDAAVPAAGGTGGNDSRESQRAFWGDGLIARRAPERDGPPRPDGGRGGLLTGDTETWPSCGAEDEQDGPSGVPEQAAGAGNRHKAGGSCGTRGPVTVPAGTTGHTAPQTTDPADDGLRQRLGALRELVALSRTRLDGQTLTEAGQVLDEASARGRLPRAYTTVAIAGATGSGKSSLFNALAGARLSETGMRRPTTAAPVACTWEAGSGTGGGAGGLLDRLGIPPAARRRLRAPGAQPDGGQNGGRYEGGREEAGRTAGGPYEHGERDGGVHDGELGGLVLIDLPDHDSVAVEHREHVDRLLRLVDAVVWVADPEKYADAVLHDRYLRPLADYAEVTFVVLNQTDRLPGEAADTVLDDLRRLLDEDGMALGEHGEPGARVFGASAVTGDGVAGLREELGEFVAGRRAAALRLTADLDGAVRRLRPVYAEPGPDATADGPVGLTAHAREDFEERLASAAGAAAAGQSAERVWLRHAEHACGTTWARLARWRAARRTGETERAGETLLGMRAEAAEPTAAGTAGPAGAVGAGGSVGPAGTGGLRGTLGARASRGLRGLPGLRGTGVAARTGGPDSAGPEERHVARPVVDRAVRELTEQASDGLPAAWGKTVRDAARRGAEGLPEALDEAVAEDTARGGEGAQLPRPTWWGVTAAAQGLLFALQVVGVLWTLAELLGLGGGVGRLPVVLAVGCAAGAPLLAWACRTAARGPARAYGLEKEQRLRRLAAGCGRARVLEPVAAELLRYREVREQYVIAAGGADRA